MKRIFLILLAVSLYGCVQPQQALHNTPSRKVEVTINNATNAQVAPLIINNMINFGYNISRSNDYMIVFEKSTDNVMASLFYGSRYDSQPNARITYSLAQLNNNVRVVADFKLVTNPGSAYERVTDFNESKETINYQRMLNDIKTQFMQQTP